MLIFIDESGTFTGFHERSLHAVGAIVVPSAHYSELSERYTRLRRRLPMENGEVKGRRLNEGQIRSVVELLRRNEVLFEVSLIDLGVQPKVAAEAFQHNLVELMHERIGKFRADVQPHVLSHVQSLSQTPLNLFLQTMVTLETIQGVIKLAPTYFAQRRPKELGEFRWIIDAKDTRITHWEAWWSAFATGSLATRSKSDPGIQMQGADYSHYERFSKGSGTDLGLLLANVNFTSGPEFGLEWADILTNATRRALVGNLRPEGWRNLRRLIVHRPGSYLNLIALGVDSPPVPSAYEHIVMSLSEEGRSLLSPAFLRQAERGD